MTTIAAPLRDPRKLAYWIIVLVVTCAAATGLKPLFVQEMGWFLGVLVALLVAFAIEVLFSQSLKEWRGSGSLTHLVLAVLFGVVSMICDAPLLFRVMQGTELTVRQFTDQRDASVRDVIIARERLAAAAEAAREVAGVSQQRAQREETKGDSCEKASPGRGVRYDFRMADAEAFQQIDKAVTARSQRLDAVVTQIQAVPPETGDALRQAMGKMNALLSTAHGIVHDPALAAAADRLDARAQSDDAVRQGRGNEAFRCQDPAIRDRARATAAQIRSLPELKQHIAVVDFTDANTVLVALPARIATTATSGIGKPGTLSGTDLAALMVSLILELLLVGAVWHLPIERTIGQRLYAAQRAMDQAPSGDIAAFLNLLGDPDPELTRLWSLLNRYRVRFWPWNVVVVAHGPADTRIVEIGHVMSVLSAIGWARRYRALPLPHMPVVCWWRWPEMRGALYREYFRIDMHALDDLNLGELLGRMRAEREVHGAGAADRRKPLLPTPALPMPAE